MSGALFALFAAALGYGTLVPLVPVYLRASGGGDAAWHSGALPAAFLAAGYHVLGTDKVGQDVLYAALKSIRTGIVIGLLTTLITLPLAIALGVAAGYFKGWVDDVIQYVYTTLNSIPAWWGAQRTALFDEMGDPATDAERHRRISPLFHAANIRRPMLVVQGANDPRVLQVESDELVAAVRRNNVPVEYVLFPDEGHGFRRKDNRVTAAEAYLRFLDQHLRR